MLVERDRAQDIAAWVHSLPCYVDLPAKLRADFEKTGLAPPAPDGDLRSSMRVNCRGLSHRAAIKSHRYLPALPRADAWQGVYTATISKTGCSFYHHEPLYPAEEYTLKLLTGVERLVEVVWCRRVDKQCFLVGTRFAEPAQNQ